MKLVEGAGLGRAPCDIRIEVVVQVGADGSEVVRDLDTHLVQMVTRSDAGQQQELRRAVNAAGDTSPLALAISMPRDVRNSTPTARPFSMTIRVACAFGLTTRFRRPLAGFR